MLSVMDADHSLAPDGILTNNNEFMKEYIPLQGITTKDGKSLSDATSTGSGAGCSKTNEQIPVYSKSTQLFSIAERLDTEVDIVLGRGPKYQLMLSRTFHSY
jgi:hypothetical protein